MGKSEPKVWENHQPSFLEMNPLAEYKEVLAAIVSATLTSDLPPIQSRRLAKQKFKKSLYAISKSLGIDFRRDEHKNFYIKCYDPAEEMIQYVRVDMLDAKFYLLQFIIKLGLGKALYTDEHLENLMQIFIQNKKMIL